MSDLLLVTTPSPPVEQLEARLGDIPFSRTAATRGREFEWGAVAVAPPREPCLTPRAGPGRFTAAVGRPILTGESAARPLCRRAAAAFASCSRPRPFLDHISGCFALVAAFADRIHIVTDPVGSLPLYVAATARGGLVVGSHPEVVASVAGLDDDFDHVSLAQLVLDTRITYPHTTRRGMRELAPGSVYSIESGDASPACVDDLQPIRYWDVAEPASSPPTGEMRDALYQACLTAADELPRHYGRVTVSLSGGSDSRAIAGAFAQNDDVEVGALTAADFENREFEVAQKIARRAGIDHRPLWRDPHYYASLLERVGRLNGYEHCSLDAHLAGLADELNEESFVVSGMGADTLLKSHYEAKVPTLMLARRLRDGVDDANIYTREDFRWQLEEKNSPGIRGELVDAIADRKWRRFKEIRTLRPRSAREWMQIYPLSRRKAIGYTLANLRQTCCDEFFHHRDILDVAVRAGQWQKVSRRLTTTVYRRLAPRLMSIPDANTRLPATAPWPVRDARYLVGVAARRAWRELTGSARLRFPSVLPQREHPWFEEGSWIDQAAFFEHSEVWAGIVERIAGGCPEGLVERLVGADASLRTLLDDGCRNHRQHYMLAQVAALGGSRFA